jgi:hypothetical protein
MQTSDGESAPWTAGHIRPGESVSGDRISLAASNNRLHLSLCSAVARVRENYDTKKQALSSLFMAQMRRN